MINPTISIIIPVYKVEPYIESCIKSILNQSFNDFEVILIDDGSPDKSSAIAKKIVKNDSRFIFLKKKNGGQGSARNMGIDYARGKYLAFIDSDDYVEPLFLQSMYEKITYDNVDICTCNVNIIEYNNITKIIKNDIDSYYNKNDFLLCLDTITSFMCDKLFKKNVFDNNRFDENIRTYEDSHLVFRLLHNHTITGVQESLYNYIQREGSTTNSYNPTYLTDKLSVMNNYLSFAEKYYSEKNIEHYLLYCYLKFYVYIVAVGLARYSNSYNIDLNRFKKNIDKSKYTKKNIKKIFKNEPKIKVALAIFLKSPLLFKILVKFSDQWKKI